MRFSDAGNIIKACRAASRYVAIVPNFQGSGGIGKTAGIGQFAESEDLGYIPKYLAQEEPSDLKGMPYADTTAGRTRFLLPEDLPTADLTMLEVLTELSKAADVDLKTVFDIDFNAAIECMGRARRGAIRRAASELYESLTKDGVTGMNQLRAAVALDRDADHDGFRQCLQRIQGRFPNGVLHLDELNRAEPQTKQAAFALLSGGRIGQYVLPAGWTIVVTENYEEGGEFDVANFKDAAWADRFVYLDWDIDAKAREDWAVWMSRKYGGAAASVIGTVASDGKMFSVKNGQVPVAKPSPRSWEKVAALVSIRSEVPEFTDELFHLTLIGLVGADAATVFLRETLPVTPMEILEDGVRAHKSELDTIASKRGSILGLMAGVIGAARDTIADNKKHQTHCLDFAEWITDCLTSNRDVVVAFLKSITEATAKEGDANGVFRANMVMSDQVARMVALGRKRMLGDPSKRDTDFTDAILARKKLQAAMAILTGKRG